jgi:hypothetical protein
MPDGSCSGMLWLTPGRTARRAAGSIPARRVLTVPPPLDITTGTQGGGQVGGRRCDSVAVIIAGARGSDDGRIGDAVSDLLPLRLPVGVCGSCPLLPPAQLPPHPDQG